MYRKGHIGLGLLAATPFAILFSFSIAPQWALLTYGVAFMTSSAPDIDQRLPLVSHRGFTHTIWFGLFLSLFFGAGTTITLSPFLLDNASVNGLSSITSLLLRNWPVVTIATVGCLTGFVSHLFGDIITEAYDYTVNPFWPVSNQAYTLGWTTADSKAWNWGLLVLGIIAAVGTVALV